MLCLVRWFLSAYSSGRDSSGKIGTLGEVGTDMSNSSTSTQDKRDRRRKVAALLAGGLVVGVGTAATLAAWNDSEYAASTFTAGSFNMQGSTDQSTFDEHTTSTGAAGLAFSVPVANLSPSDVVYAPYALRLDADTTNGANVVVDSVTTTGTVTNLSYGVVTTSAAGCNAAAFAGGTSVVADGTALSSIGSPTGFTLAKPVAPADGAPTYLCFKVTAGSGLTQGQSGAATWKFTATSN